MNLSDLLIAFARRRPIPSMEEEEELASNSSTFVALMEDNKNSATIKTKATLKRSLDLKDLILYGIGCSVGAGIYSLVGIGAQIAGPAISLSFLFCGVGCMFTSLCYADFAALIPLSGSAYTFCYVAFGELCGWIVGWNLTLGYSVSSSAVARAWSFYVASFLSSLLEKYHSLNNATTSIANTSSTLTWLTRSPVPFFADDYTCCPLSMVIIALCTLVLVTGVKESSQFNNIITIVNISVLGFVVFAGAGSVQRDNLQPFMPPDHIFGLTRAAGLVFFSFLGFDMVSCLSEEVKNPERTMPAGIVGSLLCSIIIYVVVSLVVVGMAPIPLLGDEVPLIHAFLANACCSHSQQLEQLSLGLEGNTTCLSYSCKPVVNNVFFYGSRLISFAAVFGLTTATFTCLMGQPRIFYRMAQDGLMFKIYAKVNRKTGVPTMGTIITGVFTAIVACFVNLEALASVISLGTLQVFTFVNAGVLLLRATTATALSSPAAASAIEKSQCATKRNENKYINIAMAVLAYSIFVLLGSMAASSKLALVIVCSLFACAFICALYIFLFPWPEEIQSLIGMQKKRFQCPCVPAVPMIGIFINCCMMGSFSMQTWLMVTVWIFFGLVFYLSYGIHFSELKKVVSSVESAEIKGDSEHEIGLSNEISLPLLVTTPECQYNTILTSNIS